MGLLDPKTGRRKALTKAEAAAVGGAPCVNTSPDKDCDYWSTMGECSKNAHFMKTECARSCGVCKVVKK